MRNCFRNTSVCVLAGLLLPISLSAGAQVCADVDNQKNAQSQVDPSFTNGVLIPYNNDDLILRKQLLKAAKNTDAIYFMTYEFSYGESTREFVKLLGDKAAERKSDPNAAPIIAIVDGHYARPIDNPNERDMLQWLANQGVQVFAYEYFHLPDGLKDGVESTLVENTWITHRKMLVVGDSLLMGGRNTGSLYLENLDEENGIRSFVDIDVLLRKSVGSSAADAVNQAIAIFKEMASDKKHALPIAKDENYQFKLIIPTSTQLRADANTTPLLPAALPESVDVPSQRGYYQVLKTAKNWHLFKSEWDHPANNSDLGSGDEFRTQIHKDIANEPAGGEIRIETPYFFPDNLTLDLLKEAVKRGVNVHIVTNGISTSDGLSKIIPVLMDSYYQDLKNIKNGGKVSVSLTKNHMVHAKTYEMRTNGVMFLGSHNLHVRSGFFDKEVMMRFEVDPVALAKECKTSGILAPIDYRDQTWQDLATNQLFKNHPLLYELTSVEDDIIEVYQNPNDFDEVTQKFVSSNFSKTIENQLKKSNGNIEDENTRAAVIKALQKNVFEKRIELSKTEGNFL